MNNEQLSELFRRSIIISIHIFLILFSTSIFIEFLNWLLNLSLTTPDFLMEKFFVIGELAVTPFIAIGMFILVPVMASRVLCILYFALWAFAIYQIFFCNC